MNDIKKVINSVNPRTIWEVGVGNPSISRLRPYFNTEIKLSMFEPNPSTFKSLKEAFGNVKNLEIFNFGLYDRNDTVDFLDEDDSTSMVGIDSPTKILGGGRFGLEWLENKKKTKMQIRDISEIDTGDIDVALIDTEGCEWKIISKMLSRPKFLSIETHNEIYRTPDLDKLTAWLGDNNYFYLSCSETDSWYIKL